MSQIKRILMVSGVAVLWTVSMSEQERHGHINRMFLALDTEQPLGIMKESSVDGTADSILKEGSIFEFPPTGRWEGKLFLERKNGEWKTSERHVVVGNGRIKIASDGKYEKMLSLFGKSEDTGIPCSKLTKPVKRIGINGVINGVKFSLKEDKNKETIFKLAPTEDSQLFLGALVDCIERAT